MELYTGMAADGRSYYMDEKRAMVTGWREVDGEWYYLHEDGVRTWES